VPIAFVHSTSSAVVSLLCVLDFAYSRRYRCCCHLLRSRNAHAVSLLRVKQYIYQHLCPSF
jgi:hypothetical protein